MEHMRKQAGIKLAWTRCYRYTSSSDLLRVALLKLQPASRQGEHGRRHTPYTAVFPFGDARGTFDIESALLSTPLSSTLLLTMRHKLTRPQIVLVSHMCDGSIALATPTLATTTIALSAAAEPFAAVALAAVALAATTEPFATVALATPTLATSSLQRFIL